MNRFVPHEINYGWLKYTAKISTISLYSSAVISFAILVIEILQFKWGVDVSPILNKCIAFFSLVYFVNEFVQSYIFYKAELVRILDFIDNSFNTRFAEQNSLGYYSNDEVQAGIIKMGINSFENSFFTKKITAKMLNNELIKFITIIVLLIACICLTTPAVIVWILQLALPFAIIQQTLKLYIYHCKVEHIFYNYKEAFGYSNRDYAIPAIVKNVINYERIISWASIPLDSNVFNSLNNELSEQWEAIKAHINLTD